MEGDIKAAASSSRRRSSNGSRRNSNGRRSSGNLGRSVTRKKSADTAAADRPSLEGMFNESADDDSGSDIFDVGDETASPSPRRDGGGGRRRSSHSANAPGTRRRSSTSHSPERSPRRKSASRDRRRSSKHAPASSSPPRGRAGRSTGPPSLSQTQHAARSLSAMGAGHSGSRRPTTRAELKEQGRMREWASFCRRKTYLSLEDLSREERPRVARKGAVTPFSLQLSKVCVHGRWLQTSPLLLIKHKKLATRTT